VEDTVEVHDGAELFYYLHLSEVISLTSISGETYKSELTRLQKVEEDLQAFAPTPASAPSGIKAFFGWLFCGLSVLCGISVFVISAKTRGTFDNHDRRSFFDREFDHYSRMARKPVVGWLVGAGLIFAALGMKLLGMFGS